MRTFFLLTGFIISFTAAAQVLDPVIGQFRNEIDKIVVDSTAKNYRKIHFNVTQFTRDPALGDRAAWFPVDRKTMDEYHYPGKAICTFKNDSEVVLSAKRKKEYYTIRHHRLYEKPQGHFYFSEEDSAHYTIENYRTSADEMSTSLRIIRDPEGRIIRRYNYLSGRPLLVEIFEYKNDSDYTVRSFSPNPDSVFTITYSRANNTFTPSFTKVQQKDSFLLASQTHYHIVFIPSQNCYADTITEANYDLVDGSVQATDTSVVKTYYSYDARHRLTRVTQITTDTKSVMDIVYEEKKRK